MGQSPPLFSIVVPVYNVERYLEECLDSVLAQTYEEIEIICVNDGSTDNSPDILKKYEAKDPRIVIVNKPNGGLSSARNAGLDIAKGRYVCFLDSDDYFAANACERLYTEVRTHQPDVIIFGAHIFPQEPQPSIWLETVLSPRTVFYDSFTPAVLFYETGCRPFVWRNCYAMSFLNEHGLRFEERIRFGEDQIFQFAAFPRALRFAFIEDKLYHYRWFREGSLMSTFQKEEKFRQHIRIVRTIYDHWTTTGDIERMPKEFLEWSVEFLAHDFICSRFPDKKEFAQSIAQLWESPELSPHKKALERRQRHMMDAVLGNTSGWKKVLFLIVKTLRRIRNVFRYIRHHGFRYTARRILNKLKLTG
jgi:glycosyltransferase involved in cell wall biosynthesis